MSTPLTLLYMNTHNNITALSYAAALYFWALSEIEWGEGRGGGWSVYIWRLLSLMHTKSTPFTLITSSNQQPK
jgi:hypothetical protein